MAMNINMIRLSDILFWMPVIVVIGVHTFFRQSILENVIGHSNLMVLAGILMIVSMYLRGKGK